MYEFQTIVRRPASAVPVLPVHDEIDDVEAALGHVLLKVGDVGVPAGERIVDQVENDALRWR